MGRIELNVVAPEWKTWMFCGSRVNSACDLNRVIVDSDSNGLMSRLNYNKKVDKSCVMSDKVVSKGSEYSGSG